MVHVAKLMGLRPAWIYGGEIVLNLIAFYSEVAALLNEIKRVDVIYLGTIKAFVAVSITSS